VDRELPLRKLSARDRLAVHDLCRLRGRGLRLPCGDPVRFHSCPGSPAAFSGRCGTPLTYEGARWPGEVHVLVGTMDRPEALPPAGDAFAEEKLPWVQLSDRQRR
jgi:hypothetical protein